MAALLKLVDAPTVMSDLPAQLGPDRVASATDAARATLDLRAALVEPMAEMVTRGVMPEHVVRLVLARAEAQSLPLAIQHALAALPEGLPSAATLKRWLKGYLAEGRAGLLPRHTGRVRQAYGWELRACALYNRPSKPGFADVAFNLRAEGFESATESRVKRYLKSLPATLGSHSPHRVGAHLHKLRHQRFQRRSVAELWVGEIYAGDGHTCDCYVAHPNTGKPFRPELTCWIDIKSRFIPGWYFTESESAVSTLYALSAGMVQHDHVPAWLYIDRGAGYRAHMLADQATGWYSRFDMQVIGAIPGNPHGKGWIERFFRTVRNRHDKLFDDGLAYCGDDMAPEINRRLSADMAAGRRKLRSLAEYVESFRNFIAAYHAEPMDVLGGATPAQVWAGLAEHQVVVGVEADAVLRPSAEATVTRQTVRLHNRFYFHEALALYDGHRMVVEYDLHRDGLVWVRDPKGRLVCEATLVNTIGVLPTSRLEEQRDRRLQGQVKRLERKLDEAHARRADPITAASQVRAIEQLEGAIDPALDPALARPATALPALPALPAPARRPATPSPAGLDITDVEPTRPASPTAGPHADEGEIHIDLTDWSDTP